MANKHELKTWVKHFQDVFKGVKTFELRKNDRDYKVGDILVLNEYDNEGEVFTGNLTIVKINHILHGGQFGLQKGYVIMSIEKI